MVKYVDDFLNSITMYRLVLYFLIILLLIALVLTLFGYLPFSPIDLILSAVFLTVSCGVINTILAKIFQAPTNLESAYITALILALIMTPVDSLDGLPTLFLIAFFAMASKYMVAIAKKHLFNPSAFAVALGTVSLNIGASWWAGNIWMVLFVILGGILIVRKIKREKMTLIFLLTALAIVLIPGLLRGNDLLVMTQGLILESPIFFFAFVMLSEPQTSPSDKKMQIFYGVLVGLLYTRPEWALLAGNVFSYLVSPKEKLILSLKKKIQIAPDIYDFLFSKSQKFIFLPGQYLEWTLGHNNPDSRGNRRYFTIASSPTEDNLQIGVKFYPESSSFKKALLSVDSKKIIVASQLAGDFTLPEDQTKKLAFLAGGIGITPFRSMIKYLIDTDQKRDIILLYSNKTAKDIVYKDIFKIAAWKLGIKTVYILTEKGKYIDATMIQKEMPDYKERVFYISGPHLMVDAFEKTLKDMGIHDNQIKVDYFPGYA